MTTPRRDADKERPATLTDVAVLFALLYLASDPELPARIVAWVGRVIEHSDSIRQAIRAIRRLPETGDHDD